MSVTIRTTAILLLFLVAWLLLTPLVSSASERFYLLLPPVVLGLFLAAMPNPRSWLRTQTSRGLLFIVGLAAACTICAGMWSRASHAPLGRLVPEILLALYFLVGVVLLVGMVRAALRGGGRWIAERSFGRAPQGLLARAGRIGVADILPLLLVINFTLSYLLGAFYVHRFKMPNTLTPQAALGRAYDDIAFDTDDGLTIRGWFVPASKPSAKTVIICHGLGANRSLFLDCVRVADALEANALLFDFRGHGDSDGHTCSLGHAERLDVQAAVNYLRAQRSEQAAVVIGYGISMGSAALLRAAADLEKPLDAVIVDSGFASAVELTDNILVAFPAPIRPCLTFLGVPLASLHAGCWLPECRPEDAVGSIRAPVLIIHGRHDPLIPCAHGMRLHDRASSPKRLLLVETEGHASALAADEGAYLQAVRDLVRFPERR